MNRTGNEWTLVPNIFFNPTFIYVFFILKRYEEISVKEYNTWNRRVVQKSFQASSS